MKKTGYACWLPLAALFIFSLNVSYAQTTSVSDRSVSFSYGQDAAKEDIQKRDFTSKHFKNNDGSYSAIISSGPIHYKENGHFLDIETDITPSTAIVGYPYANTSNLMKSYFGANSAAGIISLTDEGQVTEFTNVRMYWEKNGAVSNMIAASNVRANAHNNELRYANLFTAIDAKYTITEGQRELEYIINNSSFSTNAPANADYLVIAEDVKLAPTWNYEVVSNGILIKDNAGKAVYLYKSPTVKENNQFLPIGDESPAKYEVAKNGNTITVYTKVKAAWLLNSSRTFPISIDPTAQCFVSASAATPNQNTGAAFASGTITGQNDNLLSGRGSAAQGFVTGWAKFDISSIGTGNNVSAATCTYVKNSNTTAAGNQHAWGGITQNPTTATAAQLNAAGTPLYYALTTTESRNTGTLTSTLNSTAVTAIQTALTNGYFAMALYPAGSWGTNVYVIVTGRNGGTSRPYLTITYTAACSATAPTLTATANGSSTSPQYNVINTAVTLSQTTSGGNNCSGSWQYAWSNGTLYWDGTGFNSASAVYNSSYSSIAPTLTGTTTFTCYVQASGGGGTTNSSITVNAVTLPTLTAKADGNTTSETVANNVAVSLTANPSGGSGCTGSLDYAWSNDGGTTFWNGTSFSGGASYQAAYASITATVTATKTYTCYVRCSNANSATKTSTVTVTIGGCAGPTLAAEANGGGGTVTVAPGASITLDANPTGGGYCDANGVWDYAWSNDNGTTFWNGTAFSGGANYNASYTSISFTASGTGTTTYKAFARCHNNSGCASTPNTVAVTITTVCSAPTLTAQANGVGGTVTVAYSSVVALTSNPGGGANCTGTFEYAWRSGAGGNDYWNGTNFTGAATNYSTGYQDITVTNFTTSRTFQALVRCSTSPTTCTNAGTVTVNVGSCNAPTLTAKGNGTSGSVTVPTGDGVTLTANSTGGLYCDANASWQYAWSYDATHYWNGTDFTSATPVYDPSYTTINPTNITTNRTYTASVVCTGNSLCTNSSSVTVNAGACTAPTLTAKANGTTSSITIASGVSVALTANPAGGTNCAGGGTFEYAWTNGSQWWNGSSFSSSTAVYSTTYTSIASGSLTSSTSFTANARCQGNTACVSQSSVNVLISAPIFTETFEGPTSSWTLGTTGRTAWEVNSCSAHTGSKGMDTKDGTTSCDFGWDEVFIDVAASRTLDLTNYATATMTFWYKIGGRFNASYHNYGRVYIDGTNAGGGNNTQGGVSMYYVNTTWTQVTIDLTPYCGGVHTLKFTMTNETGGASNPGVAPGFEIDDINVTGTLPIGVQVSNPTLVSTGGTTQLAFNNSKISTTTPTFRAIANATGTFDTYFVEINTNPTFSGGTSWTQTFTGSYNSATAYNLAFTNGFVPVDGTTYYVRLKGSGDGGNSYSAYSSGTYSFTYVAAPVIPYWNQSTAAQFNSDVLSGVTASGSGLSLSSTSGGNVFTNPSFEASTGYPSISSWSMAGLAQYNSGYNSNAYGWISTVNSSSSNCVNCGSHITSGSNAMQFWMDGGFYECSSGSFYPGDYLVIAQKVNMTGVTSLTFDESWYSQCVNNPCGDAAVGTDFRVLIDPTNSTSPLVGTSYTVASNSGTCAGQSNGPNHLSVTGLNYTGNCTVKFVEYVTGGQLIAGTAQTYHLDNIQANAVPSGTATSTTLYLSSVQSATAWNSLKWNQTLNGGTITLKVQKYVSGAWTDAITGITAAGNGDQSYSLAALGSTGVDSIKLVATFGTSTGGTSPVMTYWAVDEASNPTINPTANGVATTDVECSGATVVLAANPTTPMPNCSGSWQYAWYNGVKYWDGTAFNSNAAVYNTAYASISVNNVAANTTFTGYVNCSANTSLTNTGTVAVTVFNGTVTGLNAAIGTPANGLNHHLSVSWNSVAGVTGYDLDYSSNGSTWTNLLTNSNVTSYDHAPGDLPNTAFYYRVRTHSNSNGCGYTTMGAPIYTACDVPALPTLGTASSTTVPVSITAETPVANPAITTYALYCPTTGQYVQANGSLGASAVYQTSATWGTTTVAGLSMNTQYCFYAMAKNNDGDIRYAAGASLSTTQTFDASSALDVSSTGSSTTKWASPGTCTYGGMAWRSTGGCTGGTSAGTVGFTTSGGGGATTCFLRSPVVNATGLSQITMNFDLTNSASSQGDNIAFSVWSTVTSQYYSGVVSSINGAAGSTMSLSGARSCSNNTVTFNLSSIPTAARGSLYLYFEPTMNESAGTSFNLLFDNISINDAVPSACITTTSCSTPAAFNVTGGGGYCSGGTGVAIGLSGSTIGVNYQLKNGASNIGSPVAGTNSSLSFGTQTSAGTYTVVATNGSCAATMTGSAAVSINPLPSTVGITPSSATITSGGAGVNLTATSSNATGFAWSPTTGLSPSSGASLNANPTSTQTYTVTASTAAGCTATGSVVITVTCGTNSWTGVTDNDWFNTSNWTCGVVPTASTNATIPTTAVRFPQISGIAGITATVKNLTIQSNASVTVIGVNGVNLEVYGNLVNNGVPSFGGGKVIFKATGVSQTITGADIFKNLEINNADGVTISSGMQSVSGVLTLKTGTLTTGGNLTITSTAAGSGLIDNFTTGNSGGISGNLTVQRYVSNPSSAFYYIGSPVNGATISDWNNDFANLSINGAVDGSQVVPTATCDPTALQASSPYGSLFDYRETTVITCNLEGWHTRFSGAIPNGQGFAGRVPDGTVLDLTGGFNSGVTPISFGTLTNSLANITGSKGYNLVANPYVAPIEWLDIAAANNGIRGTAYLYESQGTLSGTYLPVNLLTGGGEIATSQGFFVDVNNALPSTTLSFPGSARRAGSNNFLRTAAGYDHMLTLDVTGNGFADKARIAFGANFTAGFDRNYDARKIRSNEGQPSLFVTDANYDYSIYAQTTPEEVKDVPVSLVPGATGSFTITANDLGTFDGNTIVTLEDLKLHITQDLRANPAYTFMADVNDLAARFVVHFAAKTTGVANVDADGGVNITGNGNVVGINFNNFTKLDEVTVNIYDITGRKIIAQQAVATGSNHHTISVGEIVTGYYFVVLTGNNYEKASKVLLSRDK